MGKNGWKPVHATLSGAGRKLLRDEEVLSAGSRPNGSPSCCASAAIGSDTASAHKINSLCIVLSFIRSTTGKKARSALARSFAARPTGCNGKREGDPRLPRTTLAQSASRVNPDYTQCKSFCTQCKKVPPRVQPPPRAGQGAATARKGRLPATPEPVACRAKLCIFVQFG